MTSSATPESAGRDVIAAHLSDFVAQAPLVLALVDPQMRCLARSRAWSELFGPDDCDVAALPLAGLHPDDVDVLRAGLRRCFQGEKVESFDLQKTTAEGSQTWLRWSLSAIHGDPDLVTAVAVHAEDITARKLAEREVKRADERPEDITSSLDIGVLEVDFQTGALLVSDSCLRLLGISRSEVPKSVAEWVALLRSADVAAKDRVRREAPHQPGDGQFHGEVRTVVDGQERIVQVQSVVRFCGAGDERRPDSLLGIIADRTESRRLQDALVRAQRLETVGRLAGMVAHDFNNLLTVILANLELADLRTSDAEVRHLLRQAADAAQLGTSFTRRLLVLAGGQRGSAVPMVVDEHFGQVWDLFERVLSDDIHFRFQPGADGAVVAIDPAEIEAAVLNLVVNARDAQPSGGEVTLSTDIVEIGDAAARQIRGGKPGRFLRLSVRDRGQGMPPEVIARAGEPFFSTKGVGRGTGLGLTSVTLTVEHAGGFLEIISAPGEGTDARIHLPLIDPPPTLPHDKAAEFPFGNGELVLVVEDDAMLREAVMQRLEAIGYAVIEAASGDVALTLVEAGEPVDLVFSDVVMPGRLSGYDLVRKLRDSHPGIAVLLTSGHISEAYRDRIPPDPPVELLHKPYPLKTLARAVARALRQTPTPA